MLAMVAVGGNAWAHRLADMLWPQTPEAQALQALRALCADLARITGMRVRLGR